MKKFLIVLVLCLFSFIGWGNVLWWSVNDSATIHKDGGETEGIYAFVSPYYTEDDLPCVRVKMSGAGLTEPVILPIYFGAEYGWEDGEWGVILDEDGSGRWGAYWNQGGIPDELSNEALFQMEIGHGVDNWETLAYSDYFTKEMLNKEISEANDLYPPTMSWGGWTPTDFYTTSPAPPVPEPSSALFILVGVGFLGLKRKRTC